LHYLSINLFWGFFVKNIQIFVKRIVSNHKNNS
jgi:hypothetical protein